MRAVTVRCPCCGQETIEAHLGHDSTEGSRPGWELDDFDPSCDCHDYLQRVPKVMRNGVGFDAAYAKYREDIEERALEAIR